MATTGYKCWPILHFLESSFISNMEMVFVFGDLSNEAFIILNNSDVYGLGRNEAGCLGIGTTFSTTTPRKIKEFDGKSIKKFACGLGPRVVALTTDGLVYTWGSNRNNQHGSNKIPSSCIPVLCQELLNYKIVDVSCGSRQTFVLRDDGQVFTFAEQHIRCVYSTSCNKGKIVSLASNRDEQNLFLTEDSELLRYTNRVEAFVENGTGIAKIVCGHSHTLALTETGDVLAWGENGAGQLGQPGLASASQPRKVIFPDKTVIFDIATTPYNHISIAIDHTNQVFIWGHCRGQVIKQPLKCCALNMHDAMAFFGTPAVMHTPLNICDADRAGATTILGSLKLSFDNPETSDLLMEVEGQKIHVHKAILKMRSPYFKAMLSDPWLGSDNTTVNIELQSYPVYKAFLRYLYTDEIHLDDMLDIYKLFGIADQHIMPVLKQRCVIMIGIKIDVSNVVMLYEDVATKDFEELQRICVRFILGNLTAVIQTKAFAALPPALVMPILLEAANIDLFKT